MYFKEIETSAAAKAEYNRNQRAATVERLKKVAALKKTRSTK